MPRSWSSRWHAPASPTAMPSATPQPQPHPHQKHQHHQPQQPGQQLCRMTSFTQRFRSCKPASPTAATSSHMESAPQAHDPAPPASAQLPRQRRPAYVPTHAAASFARTVSPLSTTRIDEREELACDEPPSKKASTWMRSTACAAGGGHVCSSSHHSKTCPSICTAADNHAAPRNRNGPRVRRDLPAAYSLRAPRGRTEADDGNDTTDDDDNDYATFLAEAEAQHRAFRSQWARREQEREQQWAALSSLPPPGFKGAAQRDSAYYSVASMSLSRSSVSGRGSGLKLAPQKQAQAQAQAQVLRSPWSAPVPASASASTSTPSSPRTLNHKPSRTLGRRISDYFRPSSSGTGVTAIA